MCDAFWFLKAILPFQVLILWRLRVLRTHGLWCVVGSEQYNQLQYHPSSIGQFKGQGGTGDGLNRKCAYTESESSTSSSSDERAPLPKRRTQLTVLHHLYQLSVHPITNKTQHKARVYSNKSHWPLLIFTLLLLLHLQPLLLF